MFENKRKRIGKSAFGYYASEGNAARPKAQGSYASRAGIGSPLWLPLGRLLSLLRDCLRLPGKKGRVWDVPHLISESFGRGFGASAPSQRMGLLVKKLRHHLAHSLFLIPQDPLHWDCSHPYSYSSSKYYYSTS